MGNNNSTISPLEPLSVINPEDEARTLKPEDLHDCVILHKGKCTCIKVPNNSDSK